MQSPILWRAAGEAARDPPVSYDLSIASVRSGILVRRAAVGRGNRGGEGQELQNKGRDGTATDKRMSNLANKSKCAS